MWEDKVRTPLLRDRFRQTDDPCFCDGVVYLSGVAMQPRGAGDVYLSILGEISAL